MSKSAHTEDAVSEDEGLKISQKEVSSSENVEIETEPEEEGMKEK